MSRTYTGWAIKVWLVDEKGKNPEPPRYRLRDREAQECLYPSKASIQGECDRDRKDCLKTTHWRGFIPVRITITVEDE